MKSKEAKKYSKGLEFYIFNGEATLIGIGSCKDIDIIIPNKYRNCPVVRIAASALSHYSKLTNVVIPDNITSIGDYAFYGCGNLTNILFEEFSKLTSVGWSAFGYCGKLTSIRIPTSVTSISADAFYRCNSLTIYCEAKSQPENWSAHWNYSRRPVIWNYKNKELENDK